MSSANRKSNPKVSLSKTLHDFDGSGHADRRHLLIPWRGVARWYDVKSIPGSIMSIRSELRGTFLAFTLISAATLPAQTGNRGAVGSESLQQHYNNAQELQRTGKLSE